MRPPTVPYPTFDGDPKECPSVKDVLLEQFPQIDFVDVDFDRPGVYIVTQR